jgi:hypothetical protein
VEEYQVNARLQAAKDARVEDAIFQKQKNENANPSFSQFTASNCRNLNRIASNSPWVRQPDLDGFRTDFARFRLTFRRFRTDGNPAKPARNVINTSYGGIMVHA